MSVTGRKICLSVLMIGVVIMILAGACAAPAPTPTPAPTPAPTPTPAPDIKPIELKWAYHSPLTGDRPELHMWWASELEKRSGGKVKVKFFANNTLLTPTESLTGISAGIADIDVAASTYFPAQLAYTLFLENPFNAGDAWVAFKALDEIYDVSADLKSELDKVGVVRLMGETGNPFHFYAGWPMNTLDEVKGKVIRTFGGTRQAM